jgi:hypothetical protein
MKSQYYNRLHNHSVSASFSDRLIGLFVGIGLLYIGMCAIIYYFINWCFFKQNCYSHVFLSDLVSGQPFVFSLSIRFYIDVIVPEEGP